MGRDEVVVIEDVLEQEVVVREDEVTWEVLDEVVEREEGVRESIVGNVLLSQDGIMGEEVGVRDDVVGDEVLPAGDGIVEDNLVAREEVATVRNTDSCIGINGRVTKARGKVVLCGDSLIRHVGRDFCKVDSANL